MPVGPPPPDKAIGGTADLVWQRVILYSELNVLVPIESLLYLYKGDDNQHDTKTIVVQVVVPIARVTLLLASIITAMYIGLTHVAVRILIGITVGMFLIEINYTHSTVFRAKTASRVTFLAASLLPVNFVANLVADRSTPLANAIAIAQTVARGVALLIVIGSVVIRESYTRAWSCYNTDDYALFVNGPCPLYTNDFSGNNLACVDNNSPACLGHPLKSWMQPSLAVHHAGVLIGALYGFHVLNLFIVYPLIKD